MLYVHKNTKKDAPLTQSEKIQVSITVFLNPILAGLVYYFGWKKKLVIKAREANRLSFIFFAFQLLLAFFIVYFSLKSLK